MSSNQEDSWKAFERDTPAGRLLSKLYGSNQKPKINYPRIKTKKSLPQSNSFIPGGGTTVAKNSRTKQHAAKNSNRTISVPSVGGSSKATLQRYSAIDHAPIRRKRKKEIDTEMSKIKTRLEGYRLPHDNRLNTNEAKEKLQTINTLTGGSVLPSSFLPSSSLRQADLQQKKRGLLSREEELQKLSMQIRQEIEERETYMAERNDPTVTRTIQGEINSRLLELEQIKNML